MRRSKEKNRKQMCDQKKKIQSRVQKKFQIDGSEKKQDHSKINLTCNRANYKDIQQNSFFLFSQLAKVWLKNGPTRKNEEQ